MNESRVEQRVIQILMFGMGIAAVGIGAMVFLMGAPVIHLTESLFNLAVSRAIPPDPAVISPTVDSEFRFYAIFWLSYGGLVVWAARNIRTQLRLAPILMGLFFLGGIGRILSYIFVGAPHPAFVGLMVVELVAPVGVALLYVRLPK